MFFRVVSVRNRESLVAMHTLRRGLAAASPRKERARAVRRERQKQLQAEVVHRSTNEYTPVLHQQPQQTPIRYEETPRVVQAPPTFGQSMFAYASLGAGLTLGMTAVAVFFRAIGF
mmetsp:Transcript_3223/g.4465  ORF Transcript_3223/g.4465 Transcript_3223/m.4465 type:complete len:116 (+) Transcript_3223:45-392(+)